MTFAPTAPTRWAGEDAPDGIRLPAWAREACDQIDLAALVVVVAADVAAAFSELSDDEEFGSRLRASVVENLLHLSRVIGGRVRVAEVVLEPQMPRVLPAVTP